MYLEYELQVVSRVNESRDADASVVRLCIIDTPNESTYEIMVKEDTKRNERKFSRHTGRRPLKSKSCLCMVMLQLADDPR